MAAEERIPETALGKSLSRASRVVCETLSRSLSQQKTDVPGKGKKGQRPGNDLFVCFAPVPRPMLSPGREKAREAGRRKGHSGPVFSIPRLDKAGKKQSYESEEPTSPKVTCIGQVRVNKKTAQDNVGLHDDKQRKLQQSKAGSASPGRFFTSPSRQQKWGSLFGSRKESNPPVCSGIGADVSCFGFPCDPPTIMPSYREGKSCGAFLAKSLILLQESEQRCGSKTQQSGRRENYNFSQEGEEAAVGSQQAQGDRHDSEFVSKAVYKEAVSDTNDEVEAETEASDPPPPPPNALLLTRRKLEPLKLSVPPLPVSHLLKRSCSAPPQDRMNKRGKGGNVEPETACVTGTNNWQLENDFGNSPSEGTSEEDEQQLHMQANSPKAALKERKSESTDLSDNLQQDGCLESRSTCTQASAEAQSSALDEQGKSPAASEEANKQVDDEAVIARQNPKDGTADELDEQGMKKATPAPPPPSPNAVLLRRCEWEALKISLDVVPETWLWESKGIVRHNGDKGLEASSSRSSYIDGSPKDREDNVCQAHEKRPYNAGCCDAELMAACNKCSIAGHLRKVCLESAEEQRNVEPAESKGNCEHEETEECKDLEKQVEAHAQSHLEMGCSNLDVEQALSITEQILVDMLQETECVDLEKQKDLPAFSELEEGDLLEEIGLGCTDLEDRKDGQNEEGDVAMGESLNEKLSSDDNQEGNSEASSCSQSPNTVLVLGYKLEALSISFNDARGKMLNEERVHERDQKGRLEVKGRLSFQGIGKYSQLLNGGGTELIHPCSPASLPSVFRLQRCKSEPLRRLSS